MGLLSVIVWIALAAGRPQPAEVNWTSSVPLWTSLSAGGRVIDAGPGPKWASPPPAARLGALPAIKAEPELAPPPRELPPPVVEPAGPMLPAGLPAPQLIISPPNLVPIPERPEPVSPPIVAQATQRRPEKRVQSAPPDGLVVPAGQAIDRGPAARLGIPAR